MAPTFTHFLDYLAGPLANKIKCAQTKGCLQLNILVVFTIKTGEGGLGQLLTILWFVNRGQANYWLFCDFLTGVQPTTKQFCDFFYG